MLADSTVQVLMRLHDVQSNMVRKGEGQLPPHPATATFSGGNMFLVSGSEQKCTSRIFLFCGQLILDNTGLSYSLRASHMKTYSLITHRLLGALATF